VNKRYLFIMITTLALAVLACNATNLVSDSQSEEVEPGDPDEVGQPAVADQPGGGQSAGEPAAGDSAANQEETVVQPLAGEAEANQDQPAAQSSALPIGIRQGLASLDSYRLLMNMATLGPTTQDISETSMDIRYSAENDARYMRNETFESTSDDPDPSVGLEETYQIGLHSCSVSTYDDTLLRTHL